MMTAKELIELLKTYDPETMVMMLGYEGGYNDVTDVKNDDVILNYHTEWYYGNHESSSLTNGEVDKETIKAIIIL